MSDDVVRLTDYKRQGRSSRRKGARGENEVMQMIAARGWTGCRRNFGSGARGGGDLVDGPEGTHIEIKRTERLNLRGAFRQALAAARPTDTVIIAHRANDEPWLATIELDELLALLQLRETA